jgi:uncharacterized protein YggE
MLRLSRRYLPPALLVLASLCLAPAAGQAQTALKDSVPHITVTGRAEMEVVPDLAILSLAVVTERPKASAAAGENARAAQALIDEIKADGIAAKDITTVSITLRPVYDQQRDAAGRVLKKTLRGYQARNGLAIRVHAIDKAGALASRLIDKGANEFQGIRFEYEHKDAAYEKLRGEAMKDALRRAKAYLPAVGLRLGRVLEIAPPSDIVAPRRFRYAAAPAYGREAEPMSIPIEPGTLTLDTEVQVTWELSP